MRRDDGAIADMEVAGAGGLSGENYSAASGCGASEASLATEHGVRTDGAGVTDEDEVVNFCAVADSGFADRGAVHASVRLNFHVIFENSGAGLDNFVPGAVLAFGEAEAVGSDDDAVLQNDAIADTAKFADHGVRVREEIVSDLRAAIDGDGAVEDGVLADDDVVVDEAVGADVRVRSDFCGCGDDGSGMNAGRVGGRLIEEFDGFGKGEVRIAAAHEGKKRLTGIAGDGSIVVQEHGGGARCLEQRGIALVGEESDMAGLGLFEPGDAGDLQI